MTAEPITYCTDCGETFDVYRAPDERICDCCREERVAAQAKLEAVMRKAETGEQWAEICRLEAEINQRP